MFGPPFIISVVCGYLSASQSQFKSVFECLIVAGSHESSNFVSVAIYENCRWHAGDTIANAQVVVSHQHDPIHAVLLCESDNVARRVANGKTDHLNLIGAVLVVYLDQIGDFFAARRTPGSPEIEHDRLFADPFSRIAQCAVDIVSRKYKRVGCDRRAGW